MLTYQLGGVEKIWQALDLLTIAVKDKLAKRAMKAALTPIQDAAIANCPVDNGVLAGSIDIKISSKGYKGEQVSGIMGPRTNIQVPVQYHKGGLGLPPFIAIPTRYAHLVEFGHDVVDHKGVVVGHVGPVGFMRIAWDEFGGEVALYTFVAEMQIGIVQEVIAAGGGAP